MNKAVCERRIQEKMYCESLLPRRPAGPWLQSGVGGVTEAGMESGRLLPGVHSPRPLRLCFAKCSEHVREKCAESKTQPGSGEAALDFLFHLGKGKAVIFVV